MKLTMSNTEDKAMFITLLRTNILTFRYVKLDGTPRTAKGSLHPKTMNSVVPGSNGTNNAKENQITYFDMFANDWRSPRLVGQTIIIDNIEPIVEKEAPVRTTDSNLSDKIKELQTNNRLHQIYKNRERLKRELKDYLKIVEVRGLSKQHREEYLNKINDIIKTRKELRAEVKKLTK